MRTGSSRDRARRTAEDGALLCGALALSYLEALIPLTAILPLPGAKPGLANLAVMLAAYRYSMADAAAVSLARILLSALLFGSVPSMAFSAAGACCSLLVLALLRRHPGLPVSFIGISALCAAAHNLGQLGCAVLWMHETSLLGYAPALLGMAALFGSLTGLLMNIISPRLLRLPESGGGI